MENKLLQKKAEKLIIICKQKNLTVVTAESCTGGLVSAVITSVAGSSEILDRGFVSYSNKSKTEILGVPEGLILEFGAVSEEVSISMAEGAIRGSWADLAVSVTGIAGPTGGSENKPVGLVHFCLAKREMPSIPVKRMFYGSREEIRTEATGTALELLLQAAQTN